MSDPVEDYVFGVPDDEHSDDETFPPLPPPQSPGGREDGEDDGQVANGNLELGEDDAGTRVELPTVKKVVKRPQPKLDAQRLTSDKGLPALRHLFDSVKFRGKGHELEDLKTLIHNMEHWAHRLYPKLHFEDFIDRLETLGSKKEVQTCLKRIRLDLPIVHEDFVTKGEEEGDRLVQSAEDRLVQSAEELEFDPFVQSHIVASENVSCSTLTEEQRLKIERNKQIALEKRQMKMQLQQTQEVSFATQRDETDSPKLQELEDLFDDSDVEDLETKMKIPDTASSQENMDTELLLGAND
ncbi:TIMELESS-interacting protein [Protopterus annectens]|uniref:TIMELESS-interacting protein n=1 Tax=Protopterus annectens TaxID=7888 RepID=UPI001CF9846C|nr:TIMELESS-interacting protein [Protopterus annectens]XP_043933799.1 TIMELESS-interacting protein [Protopterus annectens]